jgi:Icc-related predicted phosphoesterase
MRVHVVSDVHGNSEALARAGDGADALIVLGDLLDFVDYQDHSQGILGAVFGPEKVATFAELRRVQGNALAGYARSLWDSLENAGEVVEEAIREQYGRLFGALTAPTYLTPGNVDLPSVWPDFLSDGIRVLDGETIELGGITVGFVGGGLLAPGARLRRTGVWVPYLRPEPEFDAAVAKVGAVDLLCSHIPPAVPELTYDVVARRPEAGSAALLASLREHRPRWSVFGHVHQPLATRARVHGTECVNVGFFKRTATPHVLRW